MAINSNASMDIPTKILLAIAIVGAVNWGLIGFFNFNLVDAIFGGGSMEETSAVSRVVYAIVGLAGLLGAFLLPRLHALAPRRFEDAPLAR